MPDRLASRPVTLRPQCLPVHLLVLIAICVVAAPAWAEVRTVSAEGEHRLGDRDTREAAVRLATESAKRNALEQVATYLESVTVVDGMDITKDEIRTYTAGLVIVLDQQVATTLDGDTLVVKVHLLAQIDTEDVAQAITALRQNEDARVQLVAVTLENEQLQQELDAANQALGAASSVEETQMVAQRRQEILNRVESNAMISQVWTDWVLVSPVVHSHSYISSAQLLALVANAHALYPASPHVVVAEQVIARGQARTPPSPPHPPAPGSVPPRMPTHRIVPSPGTSDAPRTLNEITHRTPTRPAHGEQEAGARRLTEVHQPNLLLPPSARQQPSSRSTMRMQQFLQQNGRFEQAPGSTALPSAPRLTPREAPIGRSPTVKEFNSSRPPRVQQAPRAPSTMTPRTFGGGGSRGAGAMQGGGGGGGGRGQGRGR